MAVQVSATDGPVERQARGTPIESPVLAGLVAGSVAAVVASLVSLPLRSPDDILFNSATVTGGTLLAGLAAGVLWRVLAGSRNRRIFFAVRWTGGFGLATAAAFLGQTQLDRVVSYTLPLAGIVFPLIGVVTVAGGRVSILKWWLAVVALVVALSVGIGLSGIGDEESGVLRLPPRSSQALSLAPEHTVRSRNAYIPCPSSTLDRTGTGPGGRNRAPAGVGLWLV